MGAAELQKFYDATVSGFKEVKTVFSEAGEAVGSKLDDVPMTKTENFQSRIDNIRDKMPNSKLKNQGNVALADVQIEGLPDEFMAHSKIHRSNSKGA